MFLLKGVTAGLSGVEENPPGMLGVSLATAAVEALSKVITKITGEI